MSRPACLPCGQLTGARQFGRQRDRRPVAQPACQRGRQRQRRSLTKSGHGRTRLNQTGLRTRYALHRARQYRCRPRYLGCSGLRHQRSVHIMPQRTATQTAHAEHAARRIDHLPQARARLARRMGGRFGRVIGIPAQNGRCCRTSTSTSGLCTSRSCTSRLRTNRLRTSRLRAGRLRHARLQKTGRLQAGGLCARRLCTSHRGTGRLLHHRGTCTLPRHLQCRQVDGNTLALLFQQRRKIRHIHGRGDACRRRRHRRSIFRPLLLAHALEIQRAERHAGRNVGQGRRLSGGAGRNRQRDRLRLHRGIVGRSGQTAVLAVCCPDAFRNGCR